MEQAADPIWNGTFFGDRCFGKFEKKYAAYYPDIASTCNIFVYRTPKIKGRGRLWSWYSTACHNLTFQAKKKCQVMAAVLDIFIQS